MKDEKIGVQIKKARSEAQMTQSELGKRIGVTWEMISRYENGKSSPRKNLEQIAEVLEKPIQYFFGVEEAPIRDEINRLSNLLEKKGMDISASAEVPLVETFEGFSVHRALKLTKQAYTAPKWISVKYKDIFAVKMNNIKSIVVNVAKGDIGFFTRDEKAKVDDYVLVKEGEDYYIKKFKKSFADSYKGVLLAIEKRFRG